MPNLFFSKKNKTGTGCFTESLLSVAYNSFELSDTLNTDSQRETLRHIFSNITNTKPLNLKPNNLPDFDLNAFLTSPLRNIPSHYLFFYLYHAIPHMTLALDAHEAALKTQRQHLADALIVNDKKMHATLTAIQEIELLRETLNKRKTEIKAWTQKRLQYFSILTRENENTLVLNDEIDDDDVYLIHCLKKMNVSVTQEAPICWSHALTPMMKMGFSENVQNFPEYSVTEQRDSATFAALKSFFFEKEKAPVSAWKKYWVQCKEKLYLNIFSGSIWKKIGLSLALTLLVSAGIYFLISGGGLLASIILGAVAVLTIAPIITKKSLDLQNWLTGKEINQRLNDLPLAALQAEFKQFIHRTKHTASILKPKDLDHLRLEINAWHEKFASVLNTLRKAKPARYHFFRRTLRTRFLLTETLIQENQATLQTQCDAIIEALINNTDPLKSHAERHSFWQNERFGRVVKEDSAISKATDFINTYARHEQKDAFIIRFKRKVSDIYHFLDILKNDQDQLLEKNLNSDGAFFSSHTPRKQKIQWYINRAVTEADTTSQKKAFQKLGAILIGSECAESDLGKPGKKIKGIFSILKLYGQNAGELEQAILLFLIKIHSPELARNFYLFPSEVQKRIITALPSEGQLQLAFRTLIEKTEDEATRVNAIVGVKKAIFCAKMANRMSVALDLEDQVGRFVVRMAKHYSGTRLGRAEEEILNIMPPQLLAETLPQLVQKRLTLAFTNGDPFSSVDIRFLFHRYRMLPGQPTLSHLLKSIEEDGRQALVVYNHNVKQLYAVGLIDQATFRLAIQASSRAYIKDANKANAIHPIDDEDSEADSAENIHFHHLFYDFQRISLLTSLYPFHKTMLHEMAEELYVGIQDTPNKARKFRTLLNQQDYYLGFMNEHPESAEQLLNDYDQRLSISTLASMASNQKTYRAAALRIAAEACPMAKKRPAPFFNQSLTDTLQETFDTVMQDAIQNRSMNIDYVLKLFRYIDQYDQYDVTQTELLGRLLNIFLKNEKAVVFLLHVYNDCPHLRTTVLGANIRTRLESIFQNLDCNKSADFETYVSYLLFRRSHRYFPLDFWRPLEEKKIAIQFRRQKPSEAYLQHETLTAENFREKQYIHKSPMTVMLTTNGLIGLANMILRYPSLYYFVSMFFESCPRIFIHPDRSNNIPYTDFWKICATVKRTQIVVNTLKQEASMRLSSARAITAGIAKFNMPRRHLFSLFNKYKNRLDLAARALDAAEQVHVEANNGKQLVSALSLAYRSYNALFVTEIPLLALQQAIMLCQHMPNYEEDVIPLHDYTWLAAVPETKKISPNLRAQLSQRRLSHAEGGKIYYDCGFDPLDLIAGMPSESFRYDSMQQYLSILGKQIIDILLPLYKWTELETNAEPEFKKSHVALFSLMMMLAEAVSMQKCALKDKISMMIFAITHHIEHLPNLFTEEGVAAKAYLNQMTKFLYYLRKYLKEIPQAGIIELASGASYHATHQFKTLLKARNNLLDHFILQKMATLSRDGKDDYQYLNELHFHEGMVCILNAFSDFLTANHRILEPKLLYSYQAEVQIYRSQLQGITQFMSQLYCYRDDTAYSQVESKKNTLHQQTQRELKILLYSGDLDVLSRHSATVESVLPIHAYESRQLQVRQPVQLNKFVPYI